MVSEPKMTPWLMIFLCLATAGCTNVTDQLTSESQHDPQIAILKQIRKVNEDGSYTYGYEAGDGSFKVESRDVLGNIKGTFGFVDAAGEVKRVSYSSANGTGFKSTTVSPLQEQVSLVQSIPRNRTTTTKKPPIVYSSSTESTSKSSVVQAIPRTRKPATITSTSSDYATETHTRPSFARPKLRHRFVINGQQRPLALEEDEIIDEDSQITKPSSSDKAANLRRVVFTKRPVDQNLRPITEEFEDKEEETKITTGNALRRQLQEETTKATPVVEHEDDHADIYGGALSTSRPLFTTSTPPRVIQRVGNLKQERQKHIYINQDNGPAKFEPSSRNYEQDMKSQQEDRSTAQQVLLRTTTRAPGDPREYIRPGPESLYVRQPPEEYGRGLPQGGVLVPAPGNNLEEDPAYRQVQLSRLLLRPDLGRLLQGQQQLYSGTTDANVHYLNDSPPAAQEQEEAAPRIPINPAFLARQRVAYGRQLPYPEPGVVDPRRQLLRPIPQPLPPLPPLPPDEREYQNLAPDYPYPMRQFALPPEPPNPIAPPLSRRDFQLLLRRLLVSQYGIQALQYPKTYLEDALYDQQPYPSYQPGYQTPIQRAEVPYPPEPVGPMPPVAPPPPPPPPPPPLPYPERIPLRRGPMYSRAINPLYQAAQYEDYPEPGYTKRVYRQKFYPQDLTDDGEEILPPQIREALLLRMLQLAISAERPIALPNNLIMTTTSPPARYRKSGPVRSVQIIGEENEEKEMRKKM